MIIYSSLSFSLSFSPLLVYSAVIAVSLFDSSSYTFTSHFFSFSLYPIDDDDRGFSVFYKRPLPGVGASKHFGVFSLSINRKLIRRIRQRARAKKKDLKKDFWRISLLVSRRLETHRRPSKMPEQAHKLRTFCSCTFMNNSSSSGERGRST